MEALQYPFDSAHILQKKRALKRELLQQPGLLDKKIAIAGGSTVGEIKPILELFLLEAGIRPTFWEGAYGLFFESVVFDDGTLAAFAPDVLYIHTSARNLRLWPAPGDDAATARQKLEDEFAHFEKVWQAAKKLNCPIVQNNFEDPAFRNFGSFDAQSPAGRTRHTRRLNERMAEYAEQNPGFYIHDFAYLAAACGLDAFCDNAAWYAYKYACAPAFIPQLCHSLANLVKSLFGRVKKAVVSDLDNTLWGGVIGEVGPQGVELGSETPAGMAYAEFQGYLAMLKSRGILMNVASKNEEAAAASGFERADSVLKKDDFLCFEANWQPKSGSVQKIAETLNIGVDSLVFVDDNPAERAQVTGALPAVAAPPIEGDAPENSIRLLDRGGYFEVSTLSADDAARNAMYKENAQRARAEAAFDDYDSYLQSLEMTAEIGPFTPAHAERITQLINKTNQFNLTTRRYTAAEVEALMADPAAVTLSGRLMDRFGDNGITTALIGHISGDTLEIGLWVMSCRVFKRQLEYALFDALVAECKRRGVTAITGSWLPTAKNLLVKDFYATIGFDLVAESEAERRFRFIIPADYQPKNTAITLL